MEWMGSVMETHRQFLSHIVIWHDVSVCDQDKLQLAEPTEQSGATDTSQELNLLTLMKKITKLVNLLKFSLTTDQVEHLFSEQEEPNNDTVFALPVESSDSDSSDFEPVYTVQPSSILIHDHTIPIPFVKIQIVPSRYHKPITTIGFLDTGAQRSTHDEHQKLLQQFFQIIQEHGIMISDKKSTIATTTISLDPTLHKSYSTFLKVTLQKSKSNSFLESLITSVISCHMSITIQIAQNPPPLKLITDGKRILQTDASDESRGAILLEECNGKEHFIAYASGQFPDAQKHYHTVYKEILAVKNESYNKLLTHRLLELPDQEGKQFTSVFIIHRPYFQHPHTKDFWTQNQSYECDENHQGNTIKTSSDPLHIHGGPITRARAKKMQAALNGLIEKIWIENAIQDARHHELGLKIRQGIVGIIQVIGKPNTQFVSNAERFKQYQDAVVGTVLTTLHAASVLLTFYPNFNLSLQDTNMSTALKVQVQIQGAEQISSAKMATLHHQQISLDLPTRDNHSDALMVLAESYKIPTIIQIPRQIPHHELIKLMSLEWISNYEKFHSNTAPIQTSESMFERRPDEAKPPYEPPPPPALLPIYKKELKWIVKHCKPETFSPNLHQTSTPQPIACMMFSSSSQDYSLNFPSLEAQSDSQKKVVTKSFIPSAITSAGQLEEPKPFESVLNWQIQNARAQNDTLVDIHKRVDKINLLTDHIETKVDSITLQMQQIYQNLQSQISQLDADLRVMLSQRYYGLEFDQKEREIRRLKAELDQIESEKHRRTLFTKSPPIPTIIKWREKLSEMSAWVDLQMIRSGATIESVLKEFVTRFTGSLGDWFDSLGPYRQLQFVQLPNVSSGLAIHT
ncbi:hypothetical protein KPL70_007548 [Citrus sinensis]|nr:hypothetical protein KPL70_007548 [Citrus sinensis]